MPILDLPRRCIASLSPWPDCATSQTMKNLFWQTGFNLSRQGRHGGGRGSVCGYKSTKHLLLTSWQAGKKRKRVRNRNEPILQDSPQVTHSCPPSSISWRLYDLHISATSQGTDHSKRKPAGDVIDSNCNTHHVLVDMLEALGEKDRVVVNNGWAPAPVLDSFNPVGTSGGDSNDITILWPSVQ